jgi:antibiotic biosynthesis monooxygenase (ABM) superfamily enzyme
MEEMNEHRPVTTILKIKYKEGCKEKCLQWMNETASIAGTFKGFIEKKIYYSTETERELVNIFTFVNNQYLQVWESSAERIRQTKKSEPFVEVIRSKSQLAGLEFMFPNTVSPKRWKMVILTVCVIFILLNSLVPILQQFFSLLHLPALVKSLLGVVTMVSLMTFLILPLLSKWLSRWLMI